MKIIVKYWFLSIFLLITTWGYSEEPESAPKDIFVSETQNSLGFKDVANELRCPTCQGLSILDSDAKFSVQMKNIVESKLKSGWDKDKILDYFTERYGPWILRQPPKTGFSLLAWILPTTLLVAGPLIIWIFFWRKKESLTTFGVRETEAILSEMDLELEQMRKKG